MYSGKKKCHTAKVQCIINRHKAIMQVDVSTVQMHDFKLFELTNPNLTHTKFILADSGYQDIQHDHTNAFTLIKATKKYPLVQEAKDYNTWLSKIRVKIEHIFAKFKAFKMFSTTYRKSLTRFERRVKLVFGWIEWFCRMSIILPQN